MQVATSADVAGSFVRALIIAVPVTASAVRLHAHPLDAPDTIAQDLNRCMRLVTIASTRRGGDSDAASLLDAVSGSPIAATDH